MNYAIRCFKKSFLTNISLKISQITKTIRENLKRQFDYSLQIDFVNMFAITYWIERRDKPIF